MAIPQDDLDREKALLRSRIARAVKSVSQSMTNKELKEGIRDSVVDQAVSEIKELNMFRMGKHLDRAYAKLADSLQEAVDNELAKYADKLHKFVVSDVKEAYESQYRTTFTELVRDRADRDARRAADDFLKGVCSTLKPNTAKKQTP